MQPQQSAQIINPQTGQREKKSCQNLYDKLITIAYSDKVVGNSYQV